LSSHNKKIKVPKHTRFNKEMFNVKSLLELIINEALVSGVYNYYLREQLYTLPNQTIIKEK
jgi:hypothetical protein